MALTQHRNEVIDISFSEAKCATIGHDSQLFLYQIDLT